MRMVIDNISKTEAREIINSQWGACIWEVIDGERVTYPTSKIAIRLFNVDGDALPTPKTTT